MAAAPTALTTGTQTATVGTEHTLYDSTAAGVLAGYVDLVNMVAGDVLELRWYLMLLTAGTRRGAFYQNFIDAQPADGLIAISVPIATELADSGALRFTLKQTQGVSRNFPYKVLAF
jgi:hypothetical protein